VEDTGLELWSVVDLAAGTNTWAGHLIPRLNFVSERVDLMASWSCLLRSSVHVLVCTYSSILATDESTSGSQFL